MQIWMRKTTKGRRKISCIHGSVSIGILLSKSLCKFLSRFLSKVGCPLSHFSGLPLPLQFCLLLHLNPPKLSFQLLLNCLSSKDNWHRSSKKIVIFVHKWCREKHSCSVCLHFKHLRGHQRCTDQLEIDSMETDCKSKHIAVMCFFSALIMGSDRGRLQTKIYCCHMHVQCTDHYIRHFTNI